jgi:hypothetical protein
MNTTDLAPVERDRLEVDADFARSRLVGTLAQLEARGRDLLDFKGQLRRHQDVLILAAGAVAILLLGRMTRWAWRRTHPADERMAALVRMWNHPHRLAR